jgi:uncharacterized membrane protein SpoIIM required for sporulation
VADERAVYASLSRTRMAHKAIARRQRKLFFLLVGLFLMVTGVVEVYSSHQAINRRATPIVQPETG